MSERFTLVKTRNGWVVDDNSRERFYLTPNEVVKLLNEQQATINKQDKEIAELDQQCADFLGARIKAQEEWEKCTDKLKEKIVEQQATIEQLRQRNQELNDNLQDTMGEIGLLNGLKEENEQLRKVCLCLKKENQSLIENIFDIYEKVKWVVR